MIIGLFLTGIPITMGQIFFIGATLMTKNTGLLTMFSFVSVIYGYLISVLKYHEQINIVCIIGALLIVFGLGKILLTSKIV